MARLDYQYISKLIDQAKENDSNAYAELYAASYPSVYTFSCVFLDDEELAKETLTKTYVLAFSSLYHLKSNGIFIQWLLEMNAMICMEYKPIERAISIDGTDYSIRQIQALPLSEFLTLLMRYYTNLSIREISKIMDVSTRRVKSAINRGKNRLKEVSYEKVSVR